MSFEQYPHSLFALVTTDASQNADGSFNNSTQSWVLVSVCREVVNGNGDMIKVADGTAIVYSSTIYLPMGVNPIPAGSIVRVCDGSSADSRLRVEGTVFKFDKLQLHNILWV